MPMNGAMVAVTAKFRKSRNLKSPRAQPNSSSSDGSKMVMPVAVMPFDRKSASIPITATTHG
jgi:hypothetical protein